MATPAAPPPLVYAPTAPPVASRLTAKHAEVTRATDGLSRSDAAQSAAAKAEAAKSKAAKAAFAKTMPQPKPHAVVDVYSNCAGMKEMHGCAMIHRNLPGDCAATCPDEEAKTDASGYDDTFEYDEQQPLPVAGADELSVVTDNLMAAGTGRGATGATSAESPLRAGYASEAALASADSEHPAGCLSTRLTLVTADYGVENSLVLDAGTPGETRIVSNSMGSHQTATYGPYCLKPGYHNVHLADVYGDGWHGGHVVINVDGVTDFTLRYDFGRDFASGEGKSYLFKVGSSYSTEVTRRRATRMLATMGRRRSSDAREKVRTDQLMAAPISFK